MKSFDLFNTLVASEAQPCGDQNRHFPIAENIAKVKPGDIIISDFYDEAKARHILTDVCGLSNQLVVTEAGKLTGRIWAALPGITEHLGDMQQSDVNSANQHGICGTLTTLADHTKTEGDILPTLPGLARAMREARLVTWDVDPMQRQRQIAQIESNFPILYCAALLLHKQLTTETVLFSSRDCYAWFRVQELIQTLTGAIYNVRYFLTSRLCRAFPSPAYLAGVNKLLANAVIVDLCGTGWSLTRLLERSSRAETPVVLLVKYDIPSLDRVYQQMGSTRGPVNIRSLVPTKHGANLERANMADHAMVLDASGEDPQYFNPCNIDWKMPEIQAQHHAIGACLEALRHYGLDLDASEEGLQRVIETSCKKMEKYDEAFAFANEFLRSEDKAVMAKLKELGRFATANG